MLYITLDGLTDPLGRSQVLPYLMGLTRRGYRITILSCEKPERLRTFGGTVRGICEEAGIRWQPIKYRRWPPILAAAWNSRRLKRRALELQERHGFDLVHCRSYIPAAAGLAVKQRHKVPFLFDMRGFWPDERVEGDSWPQSNPLFRLIYRHFKKLETKLLGAADHVISLTHAGKRELLRRTDTALADKDITVIPCCVDFDHFPLVTSTARTDARERLGIPPDTQVVGYLGSIGTWYMFREMLDFFKVYRELHPGSVLLLVTPDAEDSIRAQAREHDVDGGSLVIRSASREEVPQLMAAADFGLFFIRPVHSKTASSPTKMGEMIALGLPIMTNAGVGDVAEIVAETGCGAAIESFDRAVYEQAIRQVEQSRRDPEDVRAKAVPWFDLNVGIERYAACYTALTGAVTARKAAPRA